MIRLQTLYACAGTVALTLFLVPYEARSQELTGDPFAAPLELAGSWHLTGEELSVEEALAADIDGWLEVPVPGKWGGTPLAEHVGFAWYGLDVQIPPPERWPPDAELSLSLPPFLEASETYVGGRRIGGWGTITSHDDDRDCRRPARDRRGQPSQMIQAVPRSVVRSDGLLQLRVRVLACPAINGTHSSAQSEAIALGRRDAIAQIRELATRRLREHPQARLGSVLAIAAVAIAIFPLFIFLLDRRRSENGWYALGLLCLATAFFIAQERMQAGLATPPLYIIVNVCGFASLTVALARVIDQGGWPLKASVGCCLASGVPLLTYIEGWLPALVDSVGLLFVAASIVLDAVMVIRAIRARHPDAMVVGAGMLVATSLLVASGVLYNMDGLSVYGTWSAWPRFWLDLLQNLVFLGTLALLIARRYVRAFRDLERAHAASVRFVPTAFLALLGRTRVTDVERGDSRAAQMAVLFSDIRGFTRLSEQRAPEENFAFINRYLERMEPCISSNGGFINQYYGDGIMAIFPEADQALAAAAGMQHQIDSFNEQLTAEGEAPLKVGVGVHTGQLMLGTIGGFDRLDTGVIGDAVNLAARVEGMTKSYGCRVIVSEATRAALAAPESFSLRELDTVRAVGRDEAITIYQLTDAENRETRAGLAAVAVDFARGLAAYREGKLAEARRALIRVLEDFEDGAAEALLANTDRLAIEGSDSPSGWDGVTRLVAK